MTAKDQERCRDCEALFHYELEIRCVDCDAPICPFCVVTERWSCRGCVEAPTEERGS